MSSVSYLVKRIPDFDLCVEATPVPQARPRVVKGSTYTPKRTKIHKELVEYHAKHHLQARGSPAPYLDGPIRMDIDFFMPIPKSWPKYKQIDATEQTIKPISKPDVDNLVKLVKDALNKIVYADDSQIVAVNAAKHYTRLGEVPRTEIVIWEV